MTTARRLVLLAALSALSGLPTVWAASVTIHPAGPTVPENLLRMELRFAQPQRLPFDIERLTLLDADGQAIEHALLDLTLPSADARRITVLMDPGRVKRGAGPNRDAGRALKEGSTVSLRLAADGPDAPPIVKTWRVTAAISHPLQPATWHLTPPRRGSRDALVIDMPTPIGSSGEGLMAVLDAQGRAVRGKTALVDGDATWRFTPAQSWSSGPHSVVMHPDLEDAAGNRSCAAFEQAQASSVNCGSGASLAFRPEAAAGARAATRKTR